MYKYQSLAVEIENQILNHKFQQSEKLPSISQLAKQKHCSKETIIKAYQELEKKHLIYAKAQSGYYVADGLLKPQIESHAFSLETGNPIVAASSLIDAKHCLSIAIEQYSQSSLNISLQGVESLREILPDFLANMGIYTQKDSVYLIQGVTQMLSFLSTMTFPNHHSYILIEEPTYSYYIQFLKTTKLPILTIQRDEQGIDLKELKRLFENYDIKFFYTIPRNHNPLGTTLDSLTRQKIAELALKYNVYIIEDDYFGHCSYSPRYLPIYYYMEGKNCIYLTSFSKTIPYIRIGICVIHPQFQETFKQVMHQSYYYSYQLPSLISQATLESYLRSSLYQKQIQPLLHQLKKNYQVIKKITQDWDINIVKIISSYSGYYLSLQFSPDIDIDDLQEKLNKENIMIARNERCFYLPEHFNHSIRISLARIDPPTLQNVLPLFYQIILQTHKKTEKQ
ncbi:MAG: PLP-dependent aminotransferase family protein [Longibaculum sp.]